MTSKHLFYTVLLLLSGFIHQARADITNIVRLTFVVSLQNVDTDNGATIATAPPIRKVLATKDVLDYLAQDEPEPFAPGARLALVTRSPNEGYFIVVDSQFNVLADVSRILVFTAGNNLIFSGKRDQSDNPAPSLKGSELVTITFDDTPLGGKIQFALTGMLTGTVTRTATAIKQTASMPNSA